MLEDVDIKVQWDAIRQADIEVSRTSFIDFIDYLWDDEYAWNWHHVHLAQKLEAFYLGEITRLMVFMPPRHGKTELVSRLFPAYIFGRNPDARVIACSYSADLASAINRDVQRYMVSDRYQDVFEDSSLNNKPASTMLEAKRTGNRFEIVNHGGSYTSAGVSGPIVGKGADCLIIDDPVKNHQEAESETFRERTFQWYSSDAYSRLEKGGKVLLVMTRWHEDDLAGRLLQKSKEDPDADKWDIVSFPAIREDALNVEDPREVGEALWQDKYDLDALATIKSQLGSKYWASLYQQQPAAQEGNLLKRSWFKTYDPSDIRVGTVNFYIDSAYTANKNNDSTAILAFTRVGQELYILHCESVRLEFPELIKFIKSYVKEHGYTNSSRVIIEPKASGLSIYQQIQRDTGLNIIKDKPPKDKKATRVQAVSGKIESGRVVVPKYGSWVGAFIDECCAFPSGKFDDKVDCLVGAINHSFNGRALKMRGRSA